MPANSKVGQCTKKTRIGIVVSRLTTQFIKTTWRPLAFEKKRMSPPTTTPVPPAGIAEGTSDESTHSEYGGKNTHKHCNSVYRAMEGNLIL